MKRFFLKCCLLLIKEQNQKRDLKRIQDQYKWSSFHPTKYTKKTTLKMSNYLFYHKKTGVIPVNNYLYFLEMMECQIQYHHHLFFFLALYR